MTKASNNQSDSLAKLVFQCSPHNRKFVSPNIGVVADELLDAKKFVYTSDIITLINKTSIKIY